MPAVRRAICRPRRSAQTATRPRPAIAAHWAPRPRPATARCRRRPCRAEGPDRVDPAGIAGALLHHPGERHQDRRARARWPASPPRYIIHAKIPAKSAGCRSFAKYVCIKARFQLWVPAPLPEIGTSGAFFGLALCHSARRKQAFVTDDTGHAVRRLAPLLPRHRVHQAVLAPHLPGADAGVPGPVRAWSSSCSTSRSRRPSSPIPGSTR